MSLSRVMSLLNTSRKPFSLSFKLKPFVILAFLQQMQATHAERVCGLHQETNTSYALDYYSADFATSDIKNILLESCEALLFNCSEEMFDHEILLHCEGEINSSQPSFNLSIEIGKNLTLSFQDCLNNGMIPACKKYFDPLTPNSVTDENLIYYIFLTSLAFLTLLATCFAHFNPRQIAETSTLNTALINHIPAQPVADMPFYPSNTTQNDESNEPLWQLWGDVVGLPPANSAAANPDSNTATMTFSPRPK